VGYQNVLTSSCIPPPALKRMTGSEPTHTFVDKSRRPFCFKSGRKPASTLSGEKT
jgi:hypothetical protein